MLQGESRFMEPLQLAGRLIMENGGETYRVEETITRMGRAFGLENVESFAVPSGVFVSYRRTDGSTETAVMRVRKGATNLNRVNEVNAVSRQVEAKQLTCDEAMARLRAIEKHPSPVSRRLLILAAGVSSGGFAMMFGGTAADTAAAAVVAVIVQLATLALEKYHMHALVSTLAGSFLSAFLPMMFHAFTHLGTVEVMVAGTLMPLLPGLAMTNAVQDTMRGDIVSGTSHGISAILTAALVAGGALLAAAAMRVLGGGA